MGSRGGVAPFIAIARKLVDYGHRVRLATHATFQSWVEREADGTFEFFPLAGEPETLMKYMTSMEGRVFPKDWGELQEMLLSLPQIQEIIRQLVTSTLPAATAPSALRAAAISDSSDSEGGDDNGGDTAHSFLAEAIIAARPLENDSPLPPQFVSGLAMSQFATLALLKRSSAWQL